MNLFDDIRKIKSGDKEIKSFSRVVGLILLGGGAFLLWRGREWGASLGIAGLLLLAAGFVIPAALRPLYKAWMALGLCLGFVMSRVILTLIYYLVLTPCALLARTLGKSLLEKRFRTEASSYWIPKCEGVHAKEFYERQF